MTDARKTWRSATQTVESDDDPRLYVAALVYKSRAAAQISQEELARRAGTSQAVISAIENAVQVPGGIMLERIARALGGRLRMDLAPESQADQ